MQFTDILTQIAVPIVAVIALFFSIYNFFKNKPHITVEKHSASCSGSICKFNFYLSNIGKEPTTIKTIEFYTKKTHFMPGPTIFEGGSESVPTIDGGGIIKKKRIGLELPFQLMPNTSKLLKANLDFSDEERRKEELAESKNHFYVKILYTGKKFEKYV
ncbi:MAG: hypothetical protein ABIE94_04725 [archaeon]